MKGAFLPHRSTLERGLWKVKMEKKDRRSAAVAVAMVADPGRRDLMVPRRGPMVAHAGRGTVAVLPDDVGMPVVVTVVAVVVAGLRAGVPGAGPVPDVVGPTSAVGVHVDVAGIGGVGGTGRDVGGAACPERQGKGEQAKRSLHQNLLAGGYRNSGVHKSPD